MMNEAQVLALQTGVVCFLWFVLSGCVVELARRGVEAWRRRRRIARARREAAWWRAVR